MREDSLQVQIQKVIDDAVSQISALARKLIVSEVEATFDNIGRSAAPARSSKRTTKSAVEKPRKPRKPRKPLSAQAKANLRKNLEKAWEARRQKAAAKKSKTGAAKAKATRKPARTKK